MPMNAAQVLHVLLMVALCGSISGASEQQAPSPSGNELSAARQFGWRMAIQMVEHMEANRSQNFPGINAWLDDFAKQTKGLDPNRPPEQWPNVDCDALTTHSRH